MKLPRREFTRDCPWGEDCEKFNTPECKFPCFQQDEYFYLLETSNLPEQFKDDVIINPENRLDLIKFQALHNIKLDADYFVVDGENLSITGASGTGKTTWACKIMRQYMMYIAYNNGYVCRCIYVHLPTYIQKLKDSYGGIEDSRFKELRKQVETVPLVLWDDIDCVQNLKGALAEEIYCKFSIRSLNRLANICTGITSMKNLIANSDPKLRPYLELYKEIHFCSNINMKQSSDYTVLGNMASKKSGVFENE